MIAPRFPLIPPMGALVTNICCLHSKATLHIFAYLICNIFYSVVKLAFIPKEAKGSSLTPSDHCDLSQVQTSWSVHEHSRCFRRGKQAPCRAKLENRDTFPPHHIRQSSSQHGDAAWGLMQIFSEVTFSADTGLSLRTGIRTLAQGSLIYRFPNMCCHSLSLA